MMRWLRLRSRVRVSRMLLPDPEQLHPVAAEGVLELPSAPGTGPEDRKPPDPDEARPSREEESREVRKRRFHLHLDPSLRRRDVSFPHLPPRIERHPTGRTRPVQREKHRPTATAVSDVGLLFAGRAIDTASPAGLIPTARTGARRRRALRVILCFRHHPSPFRRRRDGEAEWHLFSTPPYVPITGYPKENNSRNRPRGPAKWPLVVAFTNSTQVSNQ
jgi:hypothetical protein